MKSVIVTLCVCFSMQRLIDAQVDKETFRLYMGRMMADDIWMKFLNEIKKQHEFCRESTFQIELASYFGRDRFDYAALEKTLFNRHEEVEVKKIYYSIQSQMASRNKYVVAAQKQPEIHIKTNPPDDDAKYWFWDGHTLRSKMYKSQVMTCNWTEWFTNPIPASFGKVFLGKDIGVDFQKWDYYSARTIESYFNHLILEITSFGAYIDGPIVGCSGEKNNKPNQMWKMYPKTFNEKVSYVPEKFSAYMSDHFDDESWFKLLIDLDQLEEECRLGYLGPYHVDIPWIIGLNVRETAYFYLKKAQLYQGLKVFKGPFSTFMTKLLDGQDWLQIILTEKRMKQECEGLEPQNSVIPKQDFPVYFSKNSIAKNASRNATFKEFQRLLINAMGSLKLDESTPAAKSKEDFTKLGQFMNDHMDDIGWKKLVGDVKNLESYCKNNLTDFQHINWAFQAGVASDPMKAHELYSYISGFYKNKD